MKRCLWKWTACLIMAAAVLHAEDWIWQSPLPQGNALNDVWVFADGRAIGIGDNGTLLVSTDGGSSWDVRTPLNGSANDFYSIFFLDDATGWIAGEIGILLKTVDRGENWISQDTGISDDIQDIHFPDPGHGWMTGRWGRIFRTSDRGATWTAQESGTWRNLRSVFFADSLTGWAVGHGGTILKTGNGGEIWEAQESGTPANLWSVMFVNADTGWIAGQDSTLLKTTNGGSDWIGLDGGTGYDYSCIRFMDPDTGLAVGFTGYLDDIGGLQKQSGVIIRTTDGGLSWSENNPESIPALNAICQADSGTGWAVGINGILLNSSNHGRTWESKSSGAAGLLTSVFCLDPDTGWIAGPGTIIKTTNGGLNWTPGNNPFAGDPHGPLYTYRSLQFVNSRKGYVLASFVQQTGMSIDLTANLLETEDGGSTWRIKRTEPLYYYMDLKMLDPDTGYVLGGYVDFTAGAFKPVLYQTTDGAVTWKKTPGNLPNTEFYSMDFIDAKTGWLAGYSGSIHKTTDGGNSWKQYRTGIRNVAFESVDFADARHGWAAGSDGIVVYSNDGGLTWERQETPTSEYLYSMSIVDYKTVWISGGNGTILSTVDGGRKWTATRIQTRNAFTGIYFPTVSTGWVVGENGSILKTTQGTTSVEEERTIPAQARLQFRLDQNHPNPFNPETAISFSLIEAADISLKVYNLLGREVALLAEGRLEAGDHQVRFQAGNLPTGVYFYRLETGGFVQTRKFIIQK
ncbi:T9SS type A sorting domain-containing protein [bacterium]|nr:T9SS type A sorting domain-containing protein [bacterium]